MSDYDPARQQDPVESGSLEDEGVAPGDRAPGDQAAGTGDEPVESAALEEEQQGKGYGASPRADAGPHAS